MTYYNPHSPFPTLLASLTVFRNNVVERGHSAKSEADRKGWMAVVADAEAAIASIEAARTKIAALDPEVDAKP